MKIAVFLPNWIGDAVMATPALRALRQRFSDAEFLGVLRPYVAPVLDGLDLVDRQLWHDPSGRERSQCGWRFLRSLRRERIDLAVLLPNSLRSACLAWAGGAKRRVGIDRDGRGWLLTDRVPAPVSGTPVSALDEYLRIARSLGCLQLTNRMELACTAADDRMFDDFRDASPLDLRDGEFISLNPGGAFGAAKHWPAEHFGELARGLVAETGRDVLVLCGPSEREEARKIVQYAASVQVAGMADGPLTLGLTKAAIRQSRLLITTDSGPRHFAPPFDVPVLTLFGPTHTGWSETYYAQAVHMQLNLDCGPCQERTCPLGHHRCMRELMPQQVLDSAMRLLRRDRSVDTRAA